MPWLETAPMEQRERFIRDHQLALYTMVELSARYGISRKTGYKWLDRFDAGGREGLGDRSRAPQRCPHKITDAVATLICEARRRHPSWGPDKLLDWLGPRHPTVDFPAVSTAGDLLARKGLVKKRRRRRHFEHPGVVPIKTAHPNDLWTADFKGHFRTRDGVYCYPLTVADQHTRYLLACHGLLSTKGLGVRPVFDRLFREYGLPNAIRTDNGVPFATTGIHGLSQLNVWWLRLGIQHQRTRPASPQENGAHERMHKTLKAEAIRPPRATLAPQQRAYRDAAAHRVSRTLHRQTHHERRDVPVQEETALHGQLAEAAHHRPRRGRRRHLVDSFLSGLVGTARRTGLHHSWIVATHTAYGSCRSRGRQERAHRSLQNAQTRFAQLPQALFPGTYS